MSYKTMLKAAQVFSRECYEMEVARAREYQDPYKHMRRGIMGANFFHHSDDPDGVLRQILINGYMGVSYTEALPELLAAKEEGLPDDTAQSLFLSGRSYYEQQTLGKGNFPLLKEVKALFAAERAKHKGEGSENCNTRYKLVSGEDLQHTVMVNIKYLIRLMEITDCSGGETFYYSGQTAPVYIDKWVDSYKECPHGIGIEGVILPIRIMGGEHCLND